MTFQTGRSSGQQGQESGRLWRGGCPDGEGLLGAGTVSSPVGVGITQVCLLHSTCATWHFSLCVSCRIKNSVKIIEKRIHPSDGGKESRGLAMGTEARSVSHLLGGCGNLRVCLFLEK